MPETPYLREPGYALRYRDDRFRTGSGPATDVRERRALRRLLAHAGATTGRWLDAPCGAGRMSDELPPPVVQLDRDPAMVAAANGPGLRVCASVNALPFADDSFAGALCHRLLQHIPTPDERVTILRELARVTNGPIVVSFFDRLSLQHLRRCVRRRFGKRRSGRSAISRRALRRELAAAGLQPTAVAALRRFVSDQTLVLCVRA
ncbi:MAG: class I SAM-dependent methyltransferase [Planctomycetes bacterium]|nr:class I SAM-dependent methyltransferase [Planctomycetota bacterium]